MKKRKKKTKMEESERSTSRALGHSALTSCLWSSKNAAKNASNLHIKYCLMDRNECDSLVIYSVLVYGNNNLCFINLLHSAQTSYCVLYVSRVNLQSELLYSAFFVCVLFCLTRINSRNSRCI